MKAILPILLIISSLSIGVIGQTPSIQKAPKLSVASPESQGISAQRLEWIDQMIEEEISEGHIPGAVALIARNGKIVYHKAFGTAEASSGRKFAKNDIFRIASQTKAITSTAVLMLWEQGLFSLDDPISKYIPEFKNPLVLDRFTYEDTSYTTKPADKEITIRHLLTHTSGLGYGVIDGDERMKMIYAKAGITDLFSTKEVTIEESVKKLAKLPLHHNPGEKFTYSEGLDVLGYFIEVISGMPFDDYLRKNLFDPLGMDDTWFYLPSDKYDRLVPVLHKVEGAWANYPVTFYDPDYPIAGAKTFFSGGAGLSSTVEDYAKFLQMYLNKGDYYGVRILSRTTVDMMMKMQTGEDLFGGESSDYGLAFGIITEGGVIQGGRGSLGTFDWGGYFNTQYFADPNENIIGLIFKQTQGWNGDRSGTLFRRLVFTSIDD